jgi:hypothetical protein
MQQKTSLIAVFFLLLFISCSDKSQKSETHQNLRILPGYHILLDDIVRSDTGVFRGLELNASSEKIKNLEGSEPAESSENHLYYEFKADSITEYSINYALVNDSLEEINVQITTTDLDLSTYLFCDLKDYYSNKLPNPREDKGYVVYNCFEGQRKPFVVSLSDNSSPTKGIINMLIYKDR